MKSDMTTLERVERVVVGKGLIPWSGRKAVLVEKSKLNMPVWKPVIAGY